jgi:EAL domain-containing protein (putative c-di-GMP-specific phosphodiesterase class I)
MSAQALDRLSLETDLRRALERGELLLHYQPQVALSSGRIIGFEALLRWRHPTRGMVSPAEFIPVAEDSGLIVQVGEWALRTACAQARAWNAEKLPVSVAVNISARQFAQPDFTRVVGSVLRDTACSPAWIELEVTESAAMRDADVTVATMQALKVMGVALAIDDFGTGFSSLSYLKRFPIDRLKVDQSFVRDLTSDPDDAAISQAVISLGHSLGLKVIAEGVETDAQLALLAGYGCDEVQGYLVSRPVPVQEATRLLMLPAPLPGMKKTAELDFLAV